MSEQPSVSVIVPHYQDLAGLDLCLSHLARQTFPLDDVEVIVSDNNSPVGEAAVAAAIAGRAKLVITREKGAGPARNGGVAAARGRILAFTDSDCRPEPDWLREGLAALQTCDFAGGRMKVVVDDPAQTTPVEAFERVFAFNNEAYVRDKGFTVTANLFCPRALFDKVGGFRNGLSEDLEWCHRASATGFRIGYAATAVVAHPARRNWAEMKTKWRRVNAEMFALAKTKRAGKLVWLLRTLFLPVSALAHTPKVLASRELDAFPQRLQALRILYGVRLWRFADSLGLLLRGN